MAASTALRATIRISPSAGLSKQVVAKGEARGRRNARASATGMWNWKRCKHVGGVAVGLATLEPECDRVDQWKRERLIESGADYIIPNFLCWNELKEHLVCRVSIRSSTVRA